MKFFKILSLFRVNFTCSICGTTTLPQDWFYFGSVSGNVSPFHGVMELTIHSQKQNQNRTSPVAE